MVHHRQELMSHASRWGPSGLLRGLDITTGLLPLSRASNSFSSDRGKDEGRGINDRDQEAAVNDHGYSFSSLWIREPGGNGCSA